MVAFSRSAHEAINIRFHNEDGSSFWQDPNDEIKAWKIVKRELAGPVRKIFQNGLYDLGYFMRMGFRVNNCVDDTMLRHHALYAELPKSLGFLGSIYADGGAWKIIGKDVRTAKRDN
jgi:hypothetical protein